ncbi:MAG: hypothetical protein OHK0015_35390 [Chloroflexi bacterium OHK40]
MSYPDAAEPLRLLIIDDDALDRQAVQRALRAGGLSISVREAEDSAAAMDALQAEDFDCILLDFQLPGADGLEVLRSLRAAGVRTPVIVLTGQSDAQVAADLMKAGAADYFDKGRLIAEALASSVRNALRVFRAEQSAARAEAERDHAAAALRHSEYLLATTLRSIGDAVIASDQQGAISFMNAMASRLTGWEASEATGQPLDAVLSLIDPGSGMPLPGIAEHVLRSGAVFEAVDGATLANRSGRRIHVAGSGAPIKDDQGSVMGVVVVLRDITERVRTEERLRLLAELSQALATSLDYREQLMSMARLAVPRLADHCAVDMLLPDGQMERVVEVAASDVAEAYAAADPVQPRLCVPLEVRDGARGTILFARGADRPPFTPEEVTFAEELARRAALAIDNALLYREAQEAIHIRDAFLSVASHELKTPLTSLLGFLDLLQRRVAPGTVVGERELRRIQVAADQAQRLNKMVTSLLDLSRLQMGQLSIEQRPVELGALIRRIADEIEPTLHENHQLRIELPAEPLPIIGDDLRLEQVIHNLIQNAVKYSPQGGQITLRLAGVDGQAWLQVEDEGMGIPREALEHIFSRFYRATNAASYQVSGMGVGLYVVRQVVNLHGGRVEAASVEGKGSTFTIWLPLAPQYGVGAATVEGEERA